MLATFRIAGFHPEGLYEFKVDKDGDGVEELTYRFVFEPRDEDGNERFIIRCIEGGDAVDPSAQGSLVAEGVTGMAVIKVDGVRAWTGKASDPFWIEPTVLHTVDHAFQDGTSINLGDWTPSQATNAFAGYTRPTASSSRTRSRAS